MNKATWIVALALVLSACHPDNPPLTGVSQPAPPAAVAKVGPRDFETSFGFFKSEATAEQQKHNENTITSFFTAKRPDGQALDNLKPENLTVTENGTNVTPFTLELAGRTEKQQAVDIALLVDITGTMVPLIEQAKIALMEFVDSEEAKKLHIRICLATFGDYTVKHCRRFYDINPRTAGEAQRRDLKRELHDLKAFEGRGRDPGYPDLDENPMRALIDSTRAPWRPDALKFVILMTDWGFLYAPDNPGVPENRARNNAPTMAQVIEALKNSQGSREGSKLKVFAITRLQHTFTSRTNKLEKHCTWVNEAARQQHCIWNGYNTPFQDQPGIVQATNGNHFDFDRVIAPKFKPDGTPNPDKIEFSSILGEIVRNVSITYKLTYVVEKVPGLDPTLPEARRDVQISLKDPNLGNLTKAGTQSSVPTGRENYKKEFNLTEHAILAGPTFNAFMNGQAVNENEYTVSGGTVKFKTEPPPGAKMKFAFFYENNELNLKLEPIPMRGNLNSSNTKVYLNDIEARPGDISFQSSLGNTTIGFNNSIMSYQPYKIREKQGVKVKIVSSAQ